MKLGDEKPVKLTTDRDRPYYKYTLAQSAEWVQNQTLTLLALQLLFLVSGYPRATTPWLPIATTLHGAWLGNKLAECRRRFSPKTLLKYSADPIISTDGRLISFTGIGVDRTEVVDPGPDLTIVPQWENPNSKPTAQALEGQRQQLTQLLQKWERLTLQHKLSPYPDRRKAFSRAVAGNGLRDHAHWLLHLPTMTDDSLFHHCASLYSAFTGSQSLAEMSKSLKKIDLQRVDIYGTAALRAIRARTFSSPRKVTLVWGPRVSRSGGLGCCAKRRKGAVRFEGCHS